MKNIIEKPRNAAKGAYNMWHRALGVESDSDIDLYKSLSQDDFDRISEKYGIENTVEYIREMESRMNKKGE